MEHTEREVRSPEEAIALLDEWITAYRELERRYAVLDQAWKSKAAALEAEVFHLHAQVCDHALAEATERIANEATEECQF